MHRLWPNDPSPASPRNCSRCPGTSRSWPSWSPRTWSPPPAAPIPRSTSKGIRAYLDAGFDEVYVGQVGSAPAGFFEFYAGQVLPRLREG